jgi:hypothetical protein
MFGGSGEVAKRWAFAYRQSGGRPVGGLARAGDISREHSEALKGLAANGA